eukprot:gene4955-6172_t
MKFKQTQRLHSVDDLREIMLSNKELQQQQQQNTTPPTFLTNHNPKDKDKKRKKLEGAKESSSPLGKLRSATLTRGVSSKLQFVVDLGSSFTKSPSKSTANALSLHSSLPSHNNGFSIGSPGPSGSNNNNSNNNHPNSKHSGNTLRRKSVRLSQQIKMDEVMKIYAPLSGSEYLTKVTPPTSSSSTSSSTPSTSTTTISVSASSLKNSPPNESIITNKENVNQIPDQNILVNSPPTSPKQQINPEWQKAAISSPTKSIRKSLQSKEDKINSIRREVIDNAEFILAQMGEYQRCVLSLPDLFLLSSDILNSEYDYLIKDTKVISKILSPLDNTSGSETDANTLSTSVSTPLKSSSNPQQQQQQQMSNNLTNSSSSSSENNITEMDLVAQSIGIIAKKLLGIETEIKKPNLSEKRAQILSSFVRAVKIYLESGEIPETPKVPTEIAQTLIKSSETTTRVYNPDEKDLIYKSGYLIKKGSKGPLVVWKDQWFTLSTEKLCIYSNENSTKSKKEILLTDIISIAPVTKYEYKHCFMVRLKSHVGGDKIIMRAASDKDAALWMLAIDGLPRKNFDTNQSCINLYIKETLLETIGSNICNYRRSVAGGVVRSSHGEEWTYRADGTIFNTDFLDTTIKPKELKYVWNGQHLIPANDSIKNLGRGKWNGVYLAWYHDGEPLLKYIWDQERNEYLNQNSTLSYKWSSRGLVSKIGVGEWLVEGNVPETVVMFLQCLRFARHKELDLNGEMIQQPENEKLYNVVIGQTLSNSSSSSSDQSYHTIQLNIKPKLLDTTKPAHIRRTDKEVHVQYNHATNQNEKFNYTGQYKQCKDYECLLIYENGVFRLEKLTGTALLSKKSENTIKDFPMDISPSPTTTTSTRKSYTEIEELPLKTNNNNTSKRSSIEVPPIDSDNDVLFTSPSQIQSQQPPPPLPSTKPRGRSKSSTSSSSTSSRSSTSGGRRGRSSTSSSTTSTTTTTTTSNQPAAPSSSSQNKLQESSESENKSMEDLAKDLEFSFNGEEDDELAMKLDQELFDGIGVNNNNNNNNSSSNVTSTTTASSTTNDNMALNDDSEDIVFEEYPVQQYDTPTRSTLITENDLNDSLFALSDSSSNIPPFSSQNDIDFMKTSNSSLSGSSSNPPPTITKPPTIIPNNNKNINQPPQQQQQQQPQPQPPPQPSISQKTVHNNNNNNNNNVSSDSSGSESDSDSSYTTGSESESESDSSDA